MAGLKTSFNTSDAFIITTEHTKQNTSVSAVYALNTKGQPLMPTTPRKFDKVLWNNIECFIFDRRKTGYFALRKIDATKIYVSAKEKKLTLLETSNTLLIEIIKRGTLPPILNDGISTAPAPHGGI